MSLSFTVELLSNASFNFYPKNTLSAFSNYLATPIELEGEWEVALVEISYPSKCYNITEGKFSYTLDRQYHLGEGGYKEPARFHSTQIVPGAYTWKTLMEEINKTAIWDFVKREKHDFLTRENFKFEATYLSHSEKLEITSHFWRGIRFESIDLARLTGAKLGKIIPDQDLGTGFGYYNSDFEVQTTPFHTIMLYTDIIDYNLVGDVRAPLLRSIPFHTQKGNVVMDENQGTQRLNYRTFKQLIFKRLSRNVFHSIRIEMRSTSGELIPFVPFESTRVVLQFRKIL